MAVSCPSEQSCVAVGRYSGTGWAPLIEAWNGTDWSPDSALAPPGSTDVYLTGVSCNSSTACIAIGYYLDSSNEQHAFSEELNGTTWSLRTAANPGFQSALAGISCTSAASCVAVGWYENGQGKKVTLAEPWNGTSWSVQRPPSPASADQSVLSGVSCRPAGTCVAVGYYGNSSGSATKTLGEVLSGSTWKLERPSNSSTLPLTQLAGVSCVSVTTCIAVGFSGYLAAPTPTGKTLAEIWNGNDWSIQRTRNRSSASESELAGVNCLAKTSCVAVGFDITGPPTHQTRTLVERYS